MKRRSSRRRHAAVEIKLSHAARLFRFVLFLAHSPRHREEILRELEIGIRTFYRELSLVKRRGIKVARQAQAYSLVTSVDKAEGLLPFPDPQFTFAEVAELAHCPGAAAHRLAELLARVTHAPAKAPRRRPNRSRTSRTPMSPERSRNN